MYLGEIQQKWHDSGQKKHQILACEEHQQTSWEWFRLRASTKLSAFDAGIPTSAASPSMRLGANKAGSVQMQWMAREIIDKL